METCWSYTIRGALGKFLEYDVSESASLWTPKYSYHFLSERTLKEITVLLGDFFKNYIRALKKKS